MLGRPAQIIAAGEDGLDHTAYWIRGAHLATGGKYVVEATDGSSKSRVEWEAFATPEGRLAKNVILLIGDGMSMAHRTAARMLSKGIVEGRYGGELAMDDMPHMALVSTSGTDSIVTDSANAMTAYTTGHKTCVNALGVYCALNRSTLGHPSIETIAELAKRRLGMAVGVVTDTEIEDATPAGMVAHTRRRTDYDDIVRMFYWLRPEVIMGGGALNFLPATDRARQAHGRRELHQQVPEGGLRVRRYGDAARRGRRQARHDKAARPVQRQQYRRRARPQVPQEGHGRQVPRPARSDRRDARGARGSRRATTRASY